MSEFIPIISVLDLTFDKASYGSDKVILKVLVLSYSFCGIKFELVIQI